MPDDSLLEGIKKSLIEEQVAYRDAMKYEVTLSVLQEAQRRLMQGLRKVGNIGNLETILLTEKRQ